MKKIILLFILILSSQLFAQEWGDWGDKWGRTSVLIEAEAPPADTFKTFLAYNDLELDNLLADSVDNDSDRIIIMANLDSSHTFNKGALISGDTTVNPILSYKNSTHQLTGWTVLTGGSTVRDTVQVDSTYADIYIFGTTVQPTNASHPIGKTYRKNWFRFPAQIPVGATIDSMKLIFTSTANQSVTPAQSRWWIEKSTNPASFTTIAGWYAKIPNYSTAYVDTTFGTWIAGSTYTFDITVLGQELLAWGSYSANQHIAIIDSGEGDQSRSVQAYDTSPTDAAKLMYVYSTSGAGDFITKDISSLGTIYGIVINGLMGVPVSNDTLILNATQYYIDGSNNLYLLNTVDTTDIYYIKEAGVTITANNLHLDNLDFQNVHNALKIFNADSVKLTRCSIINSDTALFSYNTDSLFIGTSTEGGNTFLENVINIVDSSSTKLFVYNNDIGLPNNINFKSDASTVDFKHNTFVKGYRTVFSNALEANFYFNGTHLKFKYNLGYAGKLPFGYISSNTNIDSMDYNAYLYYKSHGLYFWNIGGSEFDSLGEFQTSTSWDANSAEYVAGNDIWNNYIYGDFSLKSNSYIIGTNIPSEIKNDILRIPYNSTAPATGSHEYIPETNPPSAPEYAVDISNDTAIVNITSSTFDVDSFYVYANSTKIATIPASQTEYLYPLTAYTSSNTTFSNLAMGEIQSTTATFGGNITFAHGGDSTRLRYQLKLQSAGSYTDSVDLGWFADYCYQTVTFRIYAKNTYGISVNTDYTLSVRTTPVQVALSSLTTSTPYEIRFTALKANGVYKASASVGFTTPSSGIYSGDYFVAVDGDSLNSGTSPATAWNLGRFQYEMDAGRFVAGDTILFARNDTFHIYGVTGVAFHNLYGTYANRICFGAYGTGKKPIFDSWISVGTNHTWHSLDTTIYTALDADKVINDPIHIGGDSVWYCQFTAPFGVYLSRHLRFRYNGVELPLANYYPKWAESDKLKPYSNGEGTNTGAVPETFFINRNKTFAYVLSDVNGCGRVYLYTNGSNPNTYYNMNNMDWIGQVDSANGVNTETEGSLWDIENCYYVTFRDLEVSGGVREGIAMNKAHNMTFDSVDIHWSGEYGLAVGLGNRTSSLYGATASGQDNDSLRVTHCDIDSKDRTYFTGSGDLVRLMINGVYILSTYSNNHSNGDRIDSSIIRAWHCGILPIKSTYVNTRLQNLAIYDNEFNGNGVAYNKPIQMNYESDWRIRFYASPYASTAPAVSSVYSTDGSNRLDCEISSTSTPTFKLISGSRPSTSSGTLTKISGTGDASVTYSKCDFREAGTSDLTVDDAFMLIYRNKIDSNMSPIQLSGGDSIFICFNYVTNGIQSEMIHTNASSSSFLSSAGQSAARGNCNDNFAFNNTFVDIANHIHDDQSKAEWSNNLIVNVGKPTVHNGAWAYWIGTNMTEKNNLIWRSDLNSSTIMVASMNDGTSYADRTFSQWEAISGSTVSGNILETSQSRSQVINTDGSIPAGSDAEGAGISIVTIMSKIKEHFPDLNALGVFDDDMDGNPITESAPNIGAKQ